MGAGPAYVFKVPAVHWGCRENGPDTCARLQRVEASCPFPPGVFRLWAVLEPLRQEPAKMQMLGTTQTQSLHPV